VSEDIRSKIFCIYVLIKHFFDRFLVTFVHFFLFRGNKSAPIPSKNMFLSSFTNGVRLRRNPADEDEASVDACIEQRFGQRRQSWQKQIRVNLR